MCSWMRVQRPCIPEGRHLAGGLSVHLWVCRRPDRLLQMYRCVSGLITILTARYVLRYRERRFFFLYLFDFVYYCGMGVSEKCHLFHKQLYSTLTNGQHPAVCRIENVDCKRRPSGAGRSNVNLVEDFALLTILFHSRLVEISRIFIRYKKVRL